MRHRWLVGVIGGFCILGVLCPRLVLAQEVADSLAATHLRARMDQMVLPEVSFNETPLSMAVAQLMAKSRELDPHHEGINVVLKARASRSPGAGSIPTDPTVTLHVTKVSFEDAIRLVASLANLSYKIEDHAVLILPAEEG